MSRAKTNIGTGLASNRSRKEASRSFISVMSTRRPMMPPSLVLPLLDQDAAAVRQPLLVALARAVELRQALGEPLLLAPLGRRIVSAHDADAQRVLEPRADFEQIGAALVDVGVLLVPEDVAAFLVEEDDALRQDLDGFAQARVGGTRLGDRGNGFRASEPQRAGVETGRIPLGWLSAPSTARAAADARLARERTRQSVPLDLDAPRRHRRPSGSERGSAVCENAA